MSAIVAARKAAEAARKGDDVPAGTFNTGIEPAVVAQHEGLYVFCPVCSSK